MPFQDHHPLGHGRKEIIEAIKNQLDVLFSLQRKEIKLGLEHTHTLLDYLHNPEEDLKMIHIAGTNGKGSTAAFISSILIQKGYRVGVFTSPHLIKFNERIRVNGNFITDLEILEFLNANKSAIKKIQSTFFETTTAMALSHFKNKDVGVATVRSGNVIGGGDWSENRIIPDCIRSWAEGNEIIFFTARGTTTKIDWKELTEKQLKFANLIIANEGRKTATECAVLAGYDEESAYVRASELQNPKKYPLVVEYIGKRRSEMLKKYDISFDGHMVELGKLRDCLLYTSPSPRD